MFEDNLSHALALQPDSSASDPAALPLFDDGLTRNNNLYIATFALCGVVAAVVVAAFTLYFVRRNVRSKEKFTKLGQEDPSMEACSKDYQVRVLSAPTPFLIRHYSHYYLLLSYFLSTPGFVSCSYGL